MINKSIKIIKGKHDTNVSIRLAVLLAMVGGLLDAYTYICRGGVFANAETGNMVLLGVSLANLKFYSAFLYLIPITSFAIGVYVSHIIKNTQKNNTEIAVLIFEIIILILLIIGGDMLSNNFVNAVISFTASLQVSSFRKLINSPYCSTMCTGNLRTATDSLYSGIKNKDKSLILKCFLYLGINFSFISGAILGSFFAKKYSHNVLILGIIILIICLILFTLENYPKNNSK